VATREWPPTWIRPPKWQVFHCRRPVFPLCYSLHHNKPPDKNPYNASRWSGFRSTESLQRLRCRKNSDSLCPRRDTEMTVTKSVAEILNTPYGQYEMSSEPSRSDIESALTSSEFDGRGFQEHLQELNNEWNVSSTCEAQYCERVRQYHARRIAYFVKHGWTTPILLHPDGRTIKDGLHRLKAAIFMGRDTIEVTIEGLA